MIISAASIVKAYLQKYIYINQIKTKQCQYQDQPLARIALSVAYHIVHDMDKYIKSNKANDFSSIEESLQVHFKVLQSHIGEKQGMISQWLHPPKLPYDFDRCLTKAWYELNHYEQNHQDLKQNKTSNFTPRR